MKNLKSTMIVFQDLPDGRFSVELQGDVNEIGTKPDQEHTDAEFWCAMMFAATKKKINEQQAFERGAN